MTSEYDINLSNGSLLATILPLETNGPDNRSTPRLIQHARLSYPIVIVTPGSNTLSVPGDETLSLQVGSTIQIVDSTGNDGTYTITSAIFSTGNTIITTAENISDSTPDGFVLSHAFVLAGDVSSRFISGFVFDVQQSSQLIGQYTVTANGSASDGNITVIPVAHGSIRDNINTPIALPIGEIEYTVLDPNTSLLLPGRGVVNYGEQFAENLVRMTEHFAADVQPDLNTNIGSTPSGDPLIGQMWYRTIPGQEGFSFFDGTIWNNNVDLDNGSLIFRDPQNPIVPNTDMFISADESQLPASYTSTVEPGMVIWTENNPNPLDSIFRVLSAGGTERIRVEHDGWIRSFNNLDIIGGGNGSDESYFRGTLGIGANGLPTITKTLTVEGDGIAINSDTGIDAELLLNAPTGRVAELNFNIANTLYADLSINDVAIGTPLEINTVSSSDVILVRGGGNVGINTVGNPTTTLQIQNNIYFDEGNGNNTVGSDIRIPGLISANDTFSLNYDGNNIGSNSLDFRSGSTNTTTSILRMSLDNNKFVVDTDTLYVDTVNDRVGINMIPTYPFDVTGGARFNSPIGINNIPPSGSPVWLEITGDIQVNSQIRGSNQSANSPTYSFTNALDSGIWHSGTSLNLSYGGSNKLSISTNDITALVELKGTKFSFTGDPSTYVDTSGIGMLEIHANSSINLFTNNTSRLILSSTGGIAAATPNYETLILSDNDITNKKYVDQLAATKLNLSGGTLTGSLILASDPTSDLEAVTKQYVDSNFMPFLTNIPVSRVGELNFLPLDIDGDFTGASVPYTIGGTFMLKERDGSLIGLRPGGNGDINRYFFMHALDGLFASVVSTDAEYRPPFLAANEVVSNIINAHSYSRGFQAVITNTDTQGKKVYWIDINGTMNPAVHTFTDLTAQFSNNILFGIERVYELDLWITMTMGIGDQVVSIYDDNLVLLNTTVSTSIQTDINALPITGGFNPGGIGVLNTAIANIQHYVVGNTIHIAQHMGLYIPYTTAGISRVYSYNALINYNTSTNLFDRPYTAPFVVDPNVTVQVYPISNLAAYGRHDGSQRLTGINYTSTTFQTSIAHNQGETAIGASWEDHVDNFGATVAPYNSRIEYNISPFDASILGKTVRGAMFVGLNTILTGSFSKFPGETVVSFKRARNFLTDTTTTTTIAGSTTALIPPILSIEETDPVLLNTKVLSTIIRSNGTYQARHFDLVTGTYSTFDGDAPTIVLTPELTIPLDYNTQITNIINTLDPVANTLGVITKVHYLDSNIFVVTYSYRDATTSITTINVITVLLTGSTFSLVDSSLGLEAITSTAISDVRNGHGVFVDSINNVIYAIVPSVQFHVVGSNSSRTYLIKVDTTSPGQILALSPNRSSNPTWTTGDTGIHPNFGPYVTDTFANSQTHAVMIYTDDNTVNVVDRMRTIFDSWILANVSTTLVVITIQSPLGFTIYVSEFSVFINGSQYVVPLQNLNLTTFDPAPENSLFYIYVELVNNVPGMLFSRVQLADANTLISIGTVQTDNDGIILVNTSKTSKINGVDVDDYLNTTVDNTLEGDLILDHDPVLPLEAVTKQYVDATNFYIEVTSTGTGTVLPTGWLSSRLAAGEYLITHNLGTDQLGYSLTQTDSGVVPTASNIIATTTISFTIKFGVGVDTGFSGRVFV